MGWYRVDLDELWPDIDVRELPEGWEPQDWDRELPDDLVREYQEAQDKFMDLRDKIGHLVYKDGRWDG